jgi:hypothetical protein
MRWTTWLSLFINPYLNRGDGDAAVAAAVRDTLPAPARLRRERREPHRPSGVVGILTSVRIGAAIPGAAVQGRKSKLDATFERGSSYFSFKR